MTTTARGYGHEHQQERKRWQPLVDSGEARCMETICLLGSRAILPGSEWDLAHTTDRMGYLGPAHPVCNRTEGAKRAHKKPSTWWRL